MPRRPKPEPRDPFDPLSGPVAETLDLHGFTAVEAKAHVSAWIEQAARRNPGGILLIITGRGRGSGGRPVLGGIVRRILREGASDRIRDWGPDPGGGGMRIRVR